MNTIIDIDQKVADIFINTCGIDVSRYDNSFLNKTLNKRILDTNSNSFDEYLALLKINAIECKNLSESLQISYSEFFRNPLTYAVLEQIIFPQLIARKLNSHQSEIRIWSAACAGGHEAYSLAIILEDFKKNDSNKFNYRIFATDQSQAQINEAEIGIFNPLTIRNVSYKRINKWFTPKKDNYSIHPDLKKNIDFSIFDLLSEEFSCPPASIFGDFDIVFCANLFFYYQPKFQNQILYKATNCLSAGALLVTGEAERDLFLRHQFREVFQNFAIFSDNQLGKYNE